MFFWRRKSQEQDLERELRSHIELESEEQRHAGLSSEEAEYTARRALGNFTLIKENTRDLWTWTSLERFGQDLRYALRQLQRNPGFAAIAVLTLAIGIGVNTSVFSVIDAVLLQRPPYPDPDRLVTIWQNEPAMGELHLNTSPPEYLDYRDHNRSFLSTAGYRREAFDLTGDGEPLQVHAVRATSNLFQTLGISAQLGRTFSNAEDRERTGRVAVLSYRFWEQRYQKSEKVLGSSLRLDEKLYTVIGVMPPGFEFPASNTSVGDPPALWVPMAFTADDIADRAASFDIGVVARLKPGVSLSQARQDVKTVAEQFERQYPQVYTGNLHYETGVDPLGADVAEKTRPVLYALAGAVAFVLLIACANVANLLLARANVRQKEMAVRSALGANAARLTRQLLTETLLLTFLGGASGCLLAQAITGAAARLWPEQLVVGLRGVSVDTRALLFTLALSMLTGIVCGLAPALGWSRPDLGQSLKQAGRHIGGSIARQYLRDVLVVLEAASSVVLLVGAGLLIHSFLEVLKIPPGFNPQGIVVVRTTFNRQRYASSEKRHQAQQQILERTRALPGVTAVALTSHLPLADEREIGFTVEGRDPNEYHWAANALVSGNYFQVMGIPILNGRTFDNRDTADHPPAIIINQTMARQYWPGLDPVGKRIHWGGRRLTIVGLAGDVRLNGLDGAVEPTIYGDIFQLESGATTSAVFTMHLKTGNLASVAAAARQAIGSVDPGIPVFGTRSMNEVLARSLATRRFTMVTLAVFAAIALFLAILGLYGVLSYMVTQRTQEIGIRLALGAHPRQVIRAVLSHGLVLVGAGLTIGLLTSVLTAFALSKLSFGIPSLDFVTFVNVAVLMLVVSLFASYLPARRASRVDPMVALRYD